MKCLQSIPWSSYSEQVKWTLDRYGIEYVDLPFGQGPNPVYSTQDKVSDDVLSIMVLVFSQYSQSIRIYSHSDALKLQIDLDTRFGPACNSFYWDLKHAEFGDVKSWNCVNRLFHPFIGLLVKRYYHVQDPVAMIDKVFQQVKKQLIDNGVTLENVNDTNKYLLGKSFTAADLSFAAHAALVLLPESPMGIKLPTITQQSTTNAAQIQKWRDSLAGQFAMRMYAKERGQLHAKRTSFTEHWVWDYINLPILLFMILLPFMLAPSIGIHNSTWIFGLIVLVNWFGLITFNRLVWNLIVMRLRYCYYMYTHTFKQDTNKKYDSAQGTRVNIKTAAKASTATSNSNFSSASTAPTSSKAPTGPIDK